MTRTASNRDAFGWFGEPWPSGVCFNDADTLRENMRKPFPAGESCFYCGELFSEEAGDSGQAMPFATAGGEFRIIHVHKECALREVVGGLACHEGRCHCHGGESDAATAILSLYLQIPGAGTGRGGPPAQQMIARLTGLKQTTVSLHVREGGKLPPLDDSGWRALTRLLYAWTEWPDKPCDREAVADFLATGDEIKAELAEARQ